MDGVLPPASPTLPYLRRLALATKARHFPASVAGAMKGLTALDLSGNRFRNFPTAVSEITALQSLNLSGNNLRLGGSDVDTLAVLSHLQRLQFGRDSSGPADWPSGNIQVLIEIARRFPHLDLSGIA